MKKALLILIFFVLNNTFSQLAGESTYQFLNIPTSPRQLALGGKTITNYDYDVSQAIYNPSVINSEMDNNLSLNFFNYFADITYGSAAYAYTIDNRGNTLHFGLSYINYGNFEGYNEIGDPINDFTGNEAALSVGYANKFINAPIYYGVNIKMITSRFEQYNSLGFASDIGFYYKNDELLLDVGLVFRNLGSQIKSYDNVYEKLPFEIDLGISQLVKNAPIRWHITLENIQKWPIGLSNPSRLIIDLDGVVTEEKVTFMNDLLRHVIIGAELFPKSIFNLRLGYSFRRGEELRIVDQKNFSGLSFGFGIKFNKLRFNYSHARYSSASNVSFLGLQIDLN
tara:strand:+ start:246 stop:1262 length:1017 start_codon:yes stop_codon:yes gene_type:complete